MISKYIFKNNYKNKNNNSMTFNYNLKIIFKNKKFI